MRFEWKWIHLSFFFQQCPHLFYLMYNLHNFTHFFRHNNIYFSHGDTLCDDLYISMSYDDNTSVMSQMSLQTLRIQTNVSCQSQYFISLFLRSRWNWFSKNIESLFIFLINKKMLPDPQHFDRICRICLSSSEQLIDLFSSDEDFLNIFESITAISVGFFVWTFVENSQMYFWSNLTLFFIDFIQW